MKLYITTSYTQVLCIEGFNMFNDTITIYNRYSFGDKDLMLIRGVVYGVFFNSQEGYIKNSTNNTSDDKAKIFIPLNHSSERQFLNAYEFENAEDKSAYFTLAPGDLVVEGESHLEIRLARDLKHYYTITTVDFKNFGSPRMRHWVVHAK